MSKIEILIYVGMAVALIALVPTEEIPLAYQVMLAFAGSLLGIVAWNVINENVESDDEDK